MSKKVWIPLVSLASAVVLTAIVLITLTFTAWKVDLTVSAKQIDQTQNIEVTWDTSKDVSSVDIIVQHGATEIYSKTLKDKADIEAGKFTVPVFYGKQVVTVKANRGLYSTRESKTVKVFADEYNIAPITATMPVTIFSLALMDKDNGITKNGTIPTFVWFKRSEAWDYNNMPENVYTMPVATMEEIKSNANQPKIYERTSAWIKELYEINPSSYFNLYYNDYFAYGWMQATIGNDIPDINYKVVLLSDGTASFKFFNNHFNNDNYETEYAKMVRNYTFLKKQVVKTGTYVEGNDEYVVKAENSNEYAYVMTREESNVEWWLTRTSGTMAPDYYKDGGEETQQYKDLTALQSEGKIKVKDLNSLLNALTSEEKAELKELYNFSDTMFEKANEEDKNIMIILGTWTDTENARHFDEYVQAVKTYYGDNYVYYYKGHPRNPTNSVNGKLEHLTELGLIDVDSTIPAELLFFFNPEACGVGYQTTTFQTTTDEQCGGVFNVREADFDNATNGYLNKLEFFLTTVTSEDAKYGELVTNDTSFLFEFTKSEDYDIAIFNSADKSMTYYKEVSSEGTTTFQVVTL